MTLADVQRRLGVAPDGRWGPATEAAFMRVLGTADSPEPTGLHPRALALIKEFEGFEAKAYRDAVGVWTIGYGTTAAAGVGIDPKAGMEISETEAEMYLNRAIDKFADQIFPLMTRTPTAEQFGAMLSLAYNIGPRGRCSAA
jgi:lysozyme